MAWAKELEREVVLQTQALKKETRSALRLKAHAETARLNAEDAQQEAVDGLGEVAV